MTKVFIACLGTVATVAAAQAPRPVTGLRVMFTVPPRACPSATPPTGTIYYVATNEPGADNADCDGLSPAWKSPGHCPFKDFSAHNTFTLLRDVANVRVEVRTGRYHFGAEGFSIQGTGTTNSTRAVLTAYRDEEVVFDGDYLLNPVLRVAGQYSTVERITVEHGGGYNLRVSGTGAGNVVQCNRIGRNGSSDSLKVVDGAGPLIQYNDFYGWDSQAIDMAPGVNATVQYNDFHDSLGATAGALGTKFESHDVLFAHNHIWNSWGVNPGGISSNHAANYEAQRITIDSNLFENTLGPIAKLYSCLDCAVTNNIASTVGGGVVLGGVTVDGVSGCSSGAGCIPTTNARISGNRLRRMNGTPVRTPWLVYSTETVGLLASGNLYCTAAATAPQFFINGVSKTFVQWASAMRTDSTSVVGTEGSGACIW